MWETFVEGWSPRELEKRVYYNITSIEDYTQDTQGYTASQPANYLSAVAEMGPAPKSYSPT